MGWGGGALSLEDVARCRALAARRVVALRRRLAAGPPGGGGKWARGGRSDWAWSGRAGLQAKRGLEWWWWGGGWGRERAVIGRQGGEQGRERGNGEFGYEPANIGRQENGPELFRCPIYLRVPEVCVCTCACVRAREGASKRKCVHMRAHARAYMDALVRGGVGCRRFGGERFGRWCGGSLGRGRADGWPTSDASVMDWSPMGRARTTF